MRRTVRPVALIPSLLAIVLVLGMSGVAVSAAQEGETPAVDPALFQDLQWRLIGPFRGGRSGAVVGVPGDPLTYYQGTAGGGVWKTSDAGVSWSNVSDGYVNTASVGSIAVAPSDPNVVYVGMGEDSPRGVTTSHGDGLYRSSDAARTWTHLGLVKTRSISRIRVHPTNPDLVYLAAQGSPYMPTPERGVYRSSDGGTSWEQVHFVSESAGASDLAMDPSNPRILYAAFWDHQRMPWQMRSGGEGSGIWKSTDGGDTWQALSNGLPELMGKIGISVSAANPERLWAIIEAEPDGGVFRSDDAGASWHKTSGLRGLRSRPWYYMEIYADHPVDENTVYALNAPLYKSIDGGQTFTRLRQGHGDNHDLWINPDDNTNLISGNDGGAQVTFNGGSTWSRLNNQPSAQIYRVNTDNLFPYNVYGGQQDNSSVKIASRSFGFGITERDWEPSSGCESAYLAFDPDDPRYVYGGCYLGMISELDTTTGNGRNVQALPQLPASIPARDMLYRFNWNAPIVGSPHDTSTIYHAAQTLLRTLDRGASWEEISPDLTRNDIEKQGPGGGPITNEGAGGEVYGTIFTVSPSPGNANVIWAGSDDGLVHVTRDGGDIWENVTPADLPEVQINAIDASAHDPRRAYVAATRYKFNDFTPHIFRTDNYGATWTRRVDGIDDDDAWVRVVREDPEQSGLLYAGTETGAYVSFDDGTHWQSLQLNLPLTPITDLQVRNGDLVAATQGRAFWILDNLAPLRAIAAGVVAQGEWDLVASDGLRIGGGGSFGGFGGAAVGHNPPGPVLIDFWLSEPEDDETFDPTLEILDGDQVIRNFEADDLDAGTGHNRFAWDVRHDAVKAVPGLFVFGSLAGRRVPPGTYRARLTLDDANIADQFEVGADPRIDAAVDWEAREAFLIEATDTLTAVHEAVIRLQEVKLQIDGLSQRLAGSDAAESIRDKGTAIVERLDAIDAELVQREWTSGQDPTVFPTQLNQFLMFVRSSAEGSEENPTRGARDQFARLNQEWAGHRAELDRLLGEELGELNAMIREAGIPAVVVRRRAVPGPGETAAPVEATDTSSAAAWQAPPPPARVPENRCLARAVVSSVTPGPDPSTLRVRLPAAVEELSELELRILSADRVDEKLESLCVPETTIRAYAAGPGPDELEGKAVEAELELLGSTDVRRWWIHRIGAEFQGRR